jgi:ABC-type uncharacterized transport system ATPase subunit
MIPPHLKNIKKQTNIRNYLKMMRNMKNASILVANHVISYAQKKAITPNI